LQNSLDIIIPCYNPAPAWSNKIINSYKEICGLSGVAQINLIFVNDGSVKGIQIADIDNLKDNIPNFSYITYAINKGKGYALREGVKTSTSDFCIYTDIDFPYTLESFKKIWNALLNENADIAAGIKNDDYYNNVPPLRKLISKLLQFSTHSILRIKITDTQCGLKGFNKKGRIIFLQTTINRYLFDLEFIYLASKNKNIYLMPVGIEIKEGIQFSSMKPGILITEAFNFIRILFRRISC
jgi:glycosyltransferase involved in cell wall biosynthesis